MNVMTSLLLGIAGCLVLYYQSGRTIVVVFQNDAERRDAIWFAIIASAMLIVLALWFSTPYVG